MSRKRSSDVARLVPNYAVDDGDEDADEDEDVVCLDHSPDRLPVPGPIPVLPLGATEPQANSDRKAKSTNSISYSEELNFLALKIHPFCTVDLAFRQFRSTLEYHVTSTGKVTSFPLKVCVHCAAAKEEYEAKCAASGETANPPQIDMFHKKLGMLRHLAKCSYFQTSDVYTQLLENKGTLEWSSPGPTYAKFDKNTPRLRNKALLETIQQALAPLQQSITAGFTDMHNDFSRLHNSKAHHPSDPLRAVKRNPPALLAGAAQPTAPVLVPLNFPATYGDFMMVSHEHKQQMLEFYELPNVDNNATVTDTALRRHLGLCLPQI